MQPDLRIAFEGNNNDDDDNNDDNNNDDDGDEFDNDATVDGWVAGTTATPTSRTRSRSPW